MKRVFEHPPEPATGRKYWRSLAQFSGKPEFRQWLEREFPQGAQEYQGGEVSRRNFLQIMGASAALAGLSLSSCRRPEKHLVPFTQGVEWSIPGKALFFASSMPTRCGALPLIVATYDGRPTKIEGNPLHPAVKGASNTWAQSAILDLYDPERAHTFRRDGQEVTPAEFERALDAIVAGAGDGAGIAFLMDKCVSPTRDRLRGEIEKKFPKSAFYAYEASQGDDLAANIAFGEGFMAVPRFDKADVILAVDSDFLSCTEGSIEQIRQFGARRSVDQPDAKMNRLYVVENRYTVTGGMADHRLRLPASQLGAFLIMLATQIGQATGDAALGTVVKGLRAAAAPVFGGGEAAVTRIADWVRETAADLVSAKGRSLVLVGDRAPAAVQVLGYAINAALGNLGATLIGRKLTEKPAGKIEALARAIGDGAVKTLFILGGNPVYNAPADLAWGALQQKVPTVVRLGMHNDETGSISNWNVPQAHFLESWGDSRATDGSYTAVQPMIMPLFGGWSEIDLLAKVAGLKKPEGPELVQDTFRQVAGGEAKGFTAGWARFLRDGFLDKSAAGEEKLAFNAAGASEYVRENSALPVLGEGSFEVVLVPDSKLDDGRHANNGWLQELPDPITKLTWDNAAWISPASAKKLGVDTQDVIEVAVENRRIEIAVVVTPGHADNSLTIPLGYGRTVVGPVGRGTGVDANVLRTSRQPFLIVGAAVRRLGRTYALGITQEHGALEGRGADLTREATLDKFKEVAAAAPGSAEASYFKKLGMDAHIPENISLYSHPPLTDPYQWGMAIDLSTCTGCSACTIACQAENNIPIVGKEQVIGNREMHWLRMDRYFATDDGNVDDPEMLSQPMLCQHCENAPCETVCPVNATVHSEDGINVMAYNRCIGTRYCANNCPFKVRRFNFFDYNQRNVHGRVPGKPFTGLYEWNLTAPKGMAETLKMQKNPNVTVRMRGVMEKCTFCVQRVQEAKIAAKVYARDTGDIKIPTDSFTTACAQACPADSIVFGDIKDPNSRVSKLKEKERGYRLLEYLNVNTRMWYLARIRNPNPKMPDAGKMGSFIKHHGPDPHSPHEAGAKPGGHS
jgi:MoCo/4Fe-4S cofactor protein with predicted Tat translocation signal